MIRATHITQKMRIEDLIHRGVRGVHHGHNRILKDSITYQHRPVQDLSDLLVLDTDLLRWTVKVLVIPRRVKGKLPHIQD